MRGCRLWRRACSTPQPVERDLEQLQLQFWLTKLREELTADAPETQLYLGKRSPEDSGARAVRIAAWAMPPSASALWEGGARAVAASDDPMIRFVLKTDESARAVRKAL